MLSIQEWLNGRYPHLVKRPLIAVLPCFFSGALINTSLYYIFLFFLGLVLARRYLVLACFVFVLGIGSWQIARKDKGDLQSGEMILTGVVLNTPTLQKRSQSFILDVGDNRVLVSVKPFLVLSAGDKVEAHVHVRKIIRYSDSRLYSDYWTRRGIFYQANAQYGGTIRILSPSKGLSAVGAKWRANTYDRLLTNIPIREAKTAMGIIAGQQGLVPEDVYNSMKKTGTLHLLATSGAHILIVTTLLMLLLKHLPLARGFQIWIVILFVVIFAIAVGMRPPVIRASLMLVCYFLIYLFRRTPDGLSALGLSSMIYLFFEPFAVFDAGFHLTFMIVLVLLLFLPNSVMWLRVQIYKKTRDKLTSIIYFSLGISLLTTCIAQLGAIPLIMHHFGMMSIISPIANLLTAPFLPLIYLGTFLAQITGYFSSVVSKGFDVMITGVVSSWIEWVNIFLAKVPYSHIETPPLPFIAVVVYGVVLIMLSKPYEKPKELLLYED